jgi:hypothetical protein
MILRQSKQKYGGLTKRVRKPAGSLRVGTRADRFLPNRPFRSLVFDFASVRTQEQTSVLAAAAEIKHIGDRPGDGVK